MNITLIDGSSRAFEPGTTVLDVAGALSQGLKKAAAAGRVNGQIVDLRHRIDADCALEIVTIAQAEGLRVLRHTASHVMAQAVARLFPAALLAIGPAIDNGFYYDFDLPRALTPEDLSAIEREMDKIARENLPIERFELDRGEALRLMEGQPYKQELIAELPEGEAISFYRQGTFTDLCAGPHLMGTGGVKAFKLMQVAGAYWRGSEKNKMLQRIYGTAFEKKADLDAYISALEEAKKRDHNRVGRELEYFTTVDVIGQGLPILLPKGARVIQLMQRFVEDEEQRRGYLLTKTPLMAKSDLYKISGHWDHYREGMFVMGEEGKDDEVFALRPMTCPFQFQAYMNRTRSYRDLPIRYNETSTLFRNESSGEMHGLIRVRQFTISEGHLACRPDQVEREFEQCLELSRYMLGAVGLLEDVSFRFSKWDPGNRDKYIGAAEDWENAQTFMKKILDHVGLSYTEAEGEAAFYGPKLDIQIRNVHGKEDTLVTIQVDFQLAERFGMTYVDQDGQKKAPVVIHRTSLGCYERTLALLIEKYAGAMPTFLAPEQARLLTITDRSAPFAEEMAAKMTQSGLRVTIDDRNEKIGLKIREAQMEKIPYMLIIGDKEADEKMLAVRGRKEGDIGVMEPTAFITRVLDEVRSLAKP